MTKKNKIIKDLKSIDLTREDVEDILNDINMREHMISHVLDSEKYIVAEKVWNDIKHNKIGDIEFIDYYVDNFLKD